VRDPTLRRGLRYVEVRGMMLRVSVEGEGPPLLLINGFGANIEMWAPMRRLFAHRRTIAFDAPGAGRSDGSSKPLRIHHLADVVDELLNKLGYSVVDVLGYSWGGAVAQQFAHQHPRRVRRLVLAATAPGVGAIQNPLVVIELAVLALRGGRPTARARAAERVVGGLSARDASARAAVEAARQTSPASRAGLTQQLVSIVGWTSLRWLHRISVPTLVIGGDQDRLVPPINQKIFLARIPDCRQHLVPGGGHLFLIDQPADAVGPIEDFLADRS
jgi:pimeloyl-ACP methyl ester carboxylesterase